MSSQIKKAFANISKKINEKHRKLAFGIFGGLTFSTPVDTGRARGSWRMTLNEIDSSVEPEGQGSYSPSFSGMPEMKDVGNVIYITNNLPYIVPLNEGHSQQAGKFFVEREVKLAVKRFGSG